MIGGSDSGGGGSTPGTSGGFAPTFLLAAEVFEIPAFRQALIARPIVGSAGSVIHGGEGSILASVN